MIRSFINYIQPVQFASGCFPPNFNNTEPVTTYAFFGDGRGNKEQRQTKASLETLHAYKTLCMTQFAIANMCIRELELLNQPDDLKVKYFNEEKFRVIKGDEPGIATYYVGDRFIVMTDQELSKDEKVKGTIVGRSGIFNLKQTQIISESGK